MDRRLIELCEGLDAASVELAVELAEMFRSLPRRSRRDLRFFIEARKGGEPAFLIIEHRRRRAPNIIFVGGPLPRPFSLLVGRDD